MIKKYIVPIILNKALKNFEDRVRNQQQQPTRSNEKVGETVIDKKPSDTKSSNNSVGEYVDYEEVD